MCTFKYFCVARRCASMRRRYAHAVFVVAAGAAACGALSSGADASTKYTALDVLVF